jgi:methylglutaconyl-CoA hydratase
MSETLLYEVADGVARLTLNRPEIHNAFDDALILRLTEAIAAAGADPSVRVLVLTGAGQSFSAGGDLNWMRRMAGYSHEENLADARGLAELMATLDRCPKPTVARVQGSAFAGGMGLVACCDIAIAVPEAQFAVTEVRLGLMPAVISPYLIRAMGARQARRWFLTAARFDAAEALRLGLVHAVVPADALDAAVAAEVKALKAAAPGALTACKELIALASSPLDAALIEETAQRIAVRRASAEGRDGVSAFLEKRKPGWLV